MNVTTTRDAGGVTIIAAEETPKELQVLRSPKSAAKPEGKAS